MKAEFDVPIYKTINECAEITKLAKYHIRQLVLQNKVKYLRAGAKYLINFDSLMEYLNAGENLSTENAWKMVRKIFIKGGKNERNS